jgi:hypothetical protein
MRKLLSLLLLALSANLYAGVREPAVAGQFYPADSRELSQSVDTFLNAVPPQKIAGTLIALLAPHAGYVYSGQTAAYSYKMLADKKIDTVILIGNSHHVYLRKGAVVTDGRFKTPLGEIEINTALARHILSQTALLEENIEPHKPEHCIEVQLPFLQRTLHNFRIVPILLGDFSIDQCREIGEAVARSVQDTHRGDSVLLVASSDMSHYPSWANANMTDSAALKALRKFDPPALQATISELMSSGVPNLDCVFCGEKALYTAMFAARSLGANKAQIIFYTNSGNITGDKSRVVGYGAAVFVKTKPQAMKVLPKSPGKATGFSVSEKAQKQLLAIARQSIEYYLKNKTMLRLNITDSELLAPAAVFVTLTERGTLRGCIGTTSPADPLYEAVNRLAVAAAVEDYRFRPVTLSELKDVHIEISVLAPLEPVKNAGAIERNKHGVVVRRGGRSGLFLPQVWEHFTTKEDFLGDLCEQKAGLARDAWKDPDTKLFTFTVFAFEEQR